MYDNEAVRIGFSFVVCDERGEKNGHYAHGHDYGYLGILHWK
jgi:hypothetical protein